MATFNYAKAASTAERLLKRFGEQRTIKYWTPGSGPAHDPGEPTATELTVYMVVLPANKDRDNRLMPEDAQIDDKVRYALISAKGLTQEIEPLSTVEFDNNTWNIISASPLRPASTTILYEAMLRKI